MIARCILLVLSLSFLATTTFSQTCERPASSKDEYLIRGNQQTMLRFSRELNTSVTALTFWRDTTVYDRDGKVKAFCNTEVVFDDQGNEVVLVRASKGKLRYRTELKPGEAWTQEIYGFRKHVTSVEIKEVGELSDKAFTGQITKGAPVRMYASWPGTVDVYSQGFDVDEQKAIGLAASSWGRFVYRGEGVGQLTIRKVPMKSVLPEVPKHLEAFTRLVWIDSTVTGADIYIDPKVKKLQSVVSHELGHTLGFSDCVDCESVMETKTRKRRDGPTGLDLKLLRGKE